MVMMHKNQSVDTHKFAMIPRADIPRSAFRMQRSHKATFDAGLLIPIMCEEVLPGDSFKVKMTAFCRMATPLYPIMDNLYMDTFFFFVPNRLVWENWERFMGAQDNPGDSTSYVVPYIACPEDGYSTNSLYDHFGLPTEGQVGEGESYRHSALPLRGYKLIYREWFRDQNLISTPVIPTGDGPDLYTLYSFFRRGKRHDYFTSCLPWPQKGSSVSLPLGESAPVFRLNSSAYPTWVGAVSGNIVNGFHREVAGVSSDVTTDPLLTGTAGERLLWNTTGLYTDLSTATAATINQIRQAFQIQKLLERDARGGTRYIEIVRAHFGVVSPDARLQRPEYLGGGSTPIIVNPIAQNSATLSEEGGSTPLGTLGAMATGLAHNHGFSQAFVEHGYIIGLVSIRADLTYQQGLRKHWSRNTRYEFYFPAFAMLGEQSVLQREIYMTGVTEEDFTVFGYQERWAEYRYSPSQVVGLFRSSASGTLDGWHLAQNFTSAPVLGASFINENPPIQRVLAVGEEANGQEFLFDAFFDMQVARPMPLYSVPGLIDHF